MQWRPCWLVLMIHIILQSGESDDHEIHDQWWLLPHHRQINVYVYYSYFIL